MCPLCGAPNFREALYLASRPGVQVDDACERGEQSAAPGVVDAGRAIKAMRIVVERYLQGLLTLKDRLFARWAPRSPMAPATVGFIKQHRILRSSLAFRSPSRPGGATPRQSPDLSLIMVNGPIFLLLPRWLPALVAATPRHALPTE
jgi:hypothetical protein